jgi:uncharacterized protein HemX
MSDHIQPELPRRPKYEPAEETHDPLVDELRRRVQVLEQEKRRWKVVGISALIVLLLVVIGGGILGVGTASFYTHRLRQAQMQAEVEAMRARMEAERAMEAMEQARREAARQAEKGAK